MIRFNKPYSPSQVFSSELKKMTGDFQEKDNYIKKCQSVLKNDYSFDNVVLTDSCTAALELCALLIDIKNDDEIIIPAYTHVSTANAFALRGARPIFGDVYNDSPNLDVSQIEKLISPKTKAIVVMHYAGISREIEKLAKICKKHNVLLIEDAAHCIGAKYKDKFLGSFGDFSTFSFHKTKNISCEKGGMLVINNDTYWHKALIMKECGTDRLFTRWNLDSPYKWVSLGSNFGMPNHTAYILYHGLLDVKRVNTARMAKWNFYYKSIKQLSKEYGIQLPFKSYESEGNAHIFYILLKNELNRNELITYLNSKDIYATFHYLPLNESPYAQKEKIDSRLINTLSIYERLVRLPLHYYLTIEEQKSVILNIEKFYKNKTI